MLIYNKLIILIYYIMNKDNYISRYNYSDKGVIGKRGIKGLIGEKGCVGICGGKGDRGNKGICGNKGEQGDEGLKGLSNVGDMGTIGLKGENRTEFFNFLQCYSMGFYCDVSKDLNDLRISPKPNFIPTNYTLYTEKILDKEYRIFPQCQFKIHSLSVYINVYQSENSVVNMWQDLHIQFEFCIEIKKFSKTEISNSSKWILFENNKTINVNFLEISDSGFWTKAYENHFNERDTIILKFKYKNTCNSVLENIILKNLKTTLNIIY